MAADRGTQARITDGMVVFGDVVFHGSLILDGRIYGSVSTREGSGGHVSILANGYVERNLRSQTAVIGGNVGGDISTIGKTTVLFRAQVGGDVRYAEIELQLGAHVAGRFVRDDPAAPGNVVVLKSSVKE